MVEELDRDEFGIISHDEESGILELKWLESSATMTDDDFMRSMERYAGFAEALRPSNLLVDVTKFRHSPGEEVAPWRDQQIIPRYNAAGMKKSAFLLPPEAPGTVEAGSEPKPESPGNFPTGYFADRQRILEWFGQ